MQELRNLTDAIWINILMVVTSIPIVTVGAAITAAHDANRRALQGEAGGVTRNYFTAFRANFAKSTGAVGGVRHYRCGTGVCVGGIADHAIAGTENRLDSGLDNRV